MYWPLGPRKSQSGFEYTGELSYRVASIGIIYYISCTHYGSIVKDLKSVVVVVIIVMFSKIVKSYTRHNLGRDISDRPFIFYRDGGGARYGFFHARTIR